MHSPALRRTGYGRVVDNRAAVAIVGKLEVGERIAAMEIQCCTVGTIGHGENTVCVATVNRAEVDAFEVDLIGASERAIAGEAENRAAKGRRLVKLQHPGHSAEGDGCAVGSGEFESRAGA